MIIRIARRIEIAGMCPPIADLLGRDPADPGNFLIVSDLESVFLRFPHQKIPDILSLSGCRKYPAVFFLRDSRDPVFFEKRDQFQVIVFIEAAADTAAFFPILVDEILDGFLKELSEDYGFHIYRPMIITEKESGCEVFTEFPYDEYDIDGVDEPEDEEDETETETGE